jgi:protein associated with RNAse G/E
MSLAVKIRGIYTTALTSFLLERGIAIAFPSEETAQRFMRIEKARFSEPADVEISDLEGRQGVLIQGDPVASSRVIRLIMNSFLDVVFRERMELVPAAGEVEFAYLAKSALDEERNLIVPTLFHHHRLKTIASEVVDWVEQGELTYHPEKRKAASEDLQKKLIWDGYSPGKRIAIEHVKPDGEILYLSEGELVGADFESRTMVLKRSQFKGRSKYDGLDVEKREGDYAITEAKEGSWFYKHTYLRKDGELFGWYYNVNSPVEFYPDRIRYVDLEVDVVARPDGEVEVKDEPILERRTQEGFLSERLREKAVQVAYELRSRLITRDGV